MGRMGKMERKAIAALLAGLFVMGNAASAFGATEPSPKEEVVYGELGNGGQTEEVYVVNVFQNQRHIVDYGNYQSLRNMTSTDEITRKGSKITLDTEEETVYYQGDLERGQLPWDIDIAYWLDGETIQPEALPGSSGNLKIRMDIRENEAADPDFFENYALQVTAALDMEKSKDIKASGATEANVGGDKQLTWTLLPGTEKKLELSAQVEDFEMDRIAFNGVQMDLDVDVDSSQLTEKFDLLEKAAAAIDSGANDLSSGTASLAQGTRNMKKGVDSAAKKVGKTEKKLKKAGKLSEASSQVNQAAKDLSSGMEQIKAAANYQAFQQQLASNGLDLDALQAGNQEMLTLLQSLKQAIPAQYQGQVAKAEQLLQGNMGAIDGMEQYLQALSQSMAQAENGSREFAENYGKFDKTIQQLASQLTNIDMSAINQLTKGADALTNGSSNLEQGSETLKDATDALRGETAGMGEEAEKTIDEVVSELAGDSDAVKSFVSKKNTNVKAVQFVIKNKPIEIAETDPPAESQEKEQSLWQKFLALFR